MRWRLTAALMLATACGGPASPSAMTLAVTPTEYNPVAQTQSDVGGLLDLVRPPQGGFVLFIGAKVSGVTETTVELHGRIKDSTNAVIAENARTVTLQPLGGAPGVFTTDLRSITTVSNITLCPSASTTDLVNTVFTLEVEVTEPVSGRSGKGDVLTKLVCRQTDPTQLKLCTCQCSANYSLMKCGM